MPTAVRHPFGSHWFSTHPDEFLPIWTDEPQEKTACHHLAIKQGRAVQDKSANFYVIEIAM